jgi:dehydrogenase/reductase SDR family protein 4
MILDRFRLDGKRALVTGASRGIGRAIAIGLAEAGADVILSSRKADALNAVAAEIAHTGRRTLVVPTHVGKAADIRTLADQVNAAWGGIDILVNNAGTNPTMGPLTTVDEAAWDKTFEVNLKGPYLLVQALAAGMRERRWGRIINISSVGGLDPTPLLSVYGITKAGLNAMTKVLAAELGSSGVTVNAIAPGLIDTRFSAALTGNQAIVNHMLQSTALGRIGQPEDVVGMAVYLASEAAAFVTGQILLVDGGRVMG